MWPPVMCIWLKSQLIPALFSLISVASTYWIGSFYRSCEARI